MREVSRIYGNAEKTDEADSIYTGTPGYFFFCDQDDVWLKDKVQTELTALRELERIDCNKEMILSLVWCDMKVVNEKLNEISDSFSSYSNLKPDELDLDRCIMHGKAAGCSMACNAQLIKMCCEKSDIKNIILHDWAIFLIAKMAGRVKFIDTPLALYR